LKIPLIQGGMGVGVSLERLVEAVKPYEDTIGRRIPPAHCSRCIKTCNPAEVPYCITKALIEAVKGNYEEGLFFTGSNVGKLTGMTTVPELVKELGF